MNGWEYIEKTKGDPGAWSPEALDGAAWSPEDSDPRPPHWLDGDPCHILGQALACVMAACDWNPVRIAVAVARLGGLNYRDIGTMLGMSQEAAHKHVRILSGNSPEVGAALRWNHAGRDAFAGLGGFELLEVERRWREELAAICHDGGIARVGYNRQ